ncbi:MAG: phosphoribosylaminoimidazolecarboxamide formyltransferase [Gaiellaceae bacterium]|jgi:phosphoribosylaminoimidazolecarboxamide formyltransferase/IMP cyclohydrolase
MATQARLELRYGTNPHQSPAAINAVGEKLPFRVLNGAPSAINILDALLGWNLVRELREALGLPAAASYKHLSPAGGGLGVPLPDDLRQSYFVGDLELSPVACAYARARGADRLCSFGDCVAISDVVDEAAAALLLQEVSDAVIAPGYEPAALELLKQKKRGNYLVLEADPEVALPKIEHRDLLGVTFEQPLNDARLTIEDLRAGIVTENGELPEDAARDLLLATIALKFTQSNSITIASGGQLVGVGCGQQSRIHCVQLAANKAQLWHLRRSPLVQGLPFREGIGRPERDNAIDLYLRDEMTAKEREAWLASFSSEPRPLSAGERSEWLAGLRGMSLSSDAFIPFRDTIDRAAAVGVGYVAQTGGSIRDGEVTEAANEYGLLMTCTGVRLFTH